MKPKGTIIVCGATGFIGTAVMKVIDQRGLQAIVASRDPETARQRFPGAAGWIGYDGDALERAVAEHGRVIRLAGKNPLEGRWTKAFKAGMWESRVGTTKRLAAALARSPAPDRVLVSAGAINIHAEAGDAPVTETSALGGNWVATMLQAKEAALEPAVAAGVRCCTIRIGLALGPGNGPLAFMQRPFALHMGGHAGSGRQFVPWIHVDDLARMFVEAVENPAWQGPVIGAAPEPVRARDLARAVGQKMRRASWMHMPRPLARVVMGEMATLVVSSYRAAPARALALGFRFTCPDLGTAFDDIFGSPVAEFRRAVQPEPQV